MRVRVGRHARVPPFVPRLRDDASAPATRSGARAGHSPASRLECGTKAGLIEWTAALRSELAGTGVSFSTVCPGFVTGRGMFARFGIAPPVLLGSCTPEQVLRRCCARSGGTPASPTRRTLEAARQPSHRPRRWRKLIRRGFEHRPAPPRSPERFLVASRRGPEQLQDRCLGALPPRSCSRSRWGRAFPRARAPGTRPAASPVSAPIGVRCGPTAAGSSMLRSVRRRTRRGRFRFRRPMRHRQAPLSRT